MSSPVVRQRIKPDETIPRAQEQEDASTTKVARVSWIWKMFKVLLFLVFLFVLGLFFLPSPLDSYPVQLKPPRKLEGPLAPNDYIAKHGKRMFANQLQGPEAIIPCGDALYTGTMDSKIYKIEGEKLSLLTNIGPANCPARHGAKVAGCGRPLGMKCVEEGQTRALLVADTELGLYRVNLADGAISYLLNVNDTVEGADLLFLDDPLMLPDGRILVTQPAWPWPLHLSTMAAFENRPSGRIVEYNPSRGTGAEAARVFLKGLHFANGLALSHDKKSILITETGLLRVLRFYLDGPKKGTSEVFADNLPGFPDNITPSPDGGYWVALFGPRFDGLGPFGLDFMSFIFARPGLRNFIAKLLPQPLLLKVLAGEPIKYIVKLNGQGEIALSYHDPSNSIFAGQCSHIIEWRGALYLGSPYLPFLCKVDLPAQ